MISARQAWHDVYFIPTPDKLEIIQQHTTVSGAVSKVIFERVYNEESRQKLVAKETPSKKPQSFQKNMFDLVKVLRVIQSLPEHIQLFGHYMYGPFYDEVKDQLLDLVADNIFQKVMHELNESLTTVARLHVSSMIVDLLIKDHRLQVFGGNSKYMLDENIGRFDTQRRYSVGKICHAINREFAHVKIRVEPKHWSRYCDDVYNLTSKIIDGYEYQALTPISKMLAEIEEERLVVD